MKSEPLYEQLAAIEHERWAEWQRYLHSKCVDHSDGKGEWVCFPMELYRHWERQITTPYAELTEAEKDSDREQVARYWPYVMQDFMRRLQEHADGRDDG